MMFIVALVLAVTAMTLGFAAFSTTLNISSSASVTPNSDDFKIKLIGIDGDNKFNVLESTVSGNEGAVISDDGLYVSGIRAKLSKPGDYVRYHGLIENNGEYDAYFVGARLNKIGDTESSKKCVSTGDNPVSAELLESICGNILVSYGIYEYDENSGEIFNDIMNLGDVLEKGKKYFIHFTIKYKDVAPYADGDFEVIFGDAQLIFSSVSNNTEFRFIIDGSGYYATPGMTWEEWVDSTYSANGYTIVDNKVYFSRSQCVLVDGVKPTDVIKEGASYVFAPDDSCPE